MPGHNVFHVSQSFLFHSVAKQLQRIQKVQISASLRLTDIKHSETRMWTNAQRDGGPTEHRWRSLFTAAKFG